MNSVETSDQSEVLKKYDALRADYRRLESILEEMREEANKKKNETDAFIGKLVHDYRGPLGGIFGLAEIISEEPDLNSLPVQEFCKNIAQQAQRLLDLTNQILVISQNENLNEKLELESIDPHLIFFQPAELLIPMARRKGIKVDLSYPTEKLANVMADAKRMHSVFSNLFDNAIKYCKANECVRGWIKVESSAIHFHVADNGQGINKEKLPNLFKRFGKCGSVPTAGEGSTGLGLYIVKEIILAHGGSVSATGDNGIGLTIKVSLPLHSTPSDFPWAL